MCISENNSYIALSLLTAVSTALLVKKFSQHRTYGGEEIPSPKGAYPVFGHLLLINERVGLVFTKWHKELGSIFKVKMGSYNWVLISDPGALHELLIKQGASTSDRPELTFLSEVNSPNNSGIAFANYSKKWRNAKNAVLSVLSPKAVESMSNTLARESQRMVDMMTEDAKKNQVIDAYRYSNLAGINIIMSLAFGIPCQASLDDRYFKKIRYLVNQAMKFTSPTEDYTTLFPIMKIFDPIFKRKEKMIEFRDKEFHSFIREIADIARKSKGDNLVKKIDMAAEKYELSDQNVMSILSEALFVNTETLSSTISWAIATLCHYPEVQKRAYDEINSFIEINGRHPEYSDRNCLPYFCAILKESLRFRLPMELTSPHLVTEDVFYKNYMIPKGHVIYVNVHTMNNDPSLFPNPEKFDPERFMDDTRTLHTVSNGNIEKRSIYGFGWGRRICPGIHLTENHMFHVLSRVLATCIIEPEILPSGDKLYPNLEKAIDSGFAIGPVPYKVRLTEREDREIA